MLVIKYLRNYYPIIILVFFVFANSIPDVYIPFLRNSYAKRFPEMWEKEPNNGEYSPLVVAGPGTGNWALDEVEAASKVVEFLRNGKPYDLYPKENKYSLFWIQDFISYGILAVIQKLVGNITKTWIISKILFTFLWLVMIYVICQQFKLPKSYSIFCSVFTFYFGNVFNTIYYNFPDLYITIVKSINNFFTIDFTDPSSAYSRLPNPLLSYSFLFIAFFILMKIYLPENISDFNKTKIKYFKNTLYGIFIGVIMYIHPNECSFFIIYLLVLTIILWYYKFKNLSLNIFMSILIAVFLSFPITYLYLFDKTTFLNYGMVYSRIPDYRTIVFLIIIYLIWYFYCKKKLLSFKQYLVFLTIGLTAFIMQNHQVLVGALILKNVVIISSFFIILLVLLIFGNFCIKKVLKNNFSLLSLMLITITLVLVINKGLIYSQNNYKVMGLPKSYEKAFDWLKTNTPKNSVIGTLSSEFIDLLPLYSDNISYVSNSRPIMSHITSDENVSRYIDLLKIMEVNREKLGNKLRLWDLDYLSKHRSNYLHKYLLFQEVNRNDFEVINFIDIIRGKELNDFVYLNDNKALKKLIDDMFSDHFNQQCEKENINANNLYTPRFELSYLLIDPWTKQFMTEELNYTLLYDEDDIKIYKFGQNNLDIDK